MIGAFVIGLLIIFIGLQRHARKVEREFYRGQLGRASEVESELRKEVKELWKITDEQADLLHAKVESGCLCTITCPLCSKVLNYEENTTIYCPYCGTGMGRGGR